jgi:hypothetical protein
MRNRSLADTKTQILENAVRQLRHSANCLERMIRCGSDRQLAETCGMLDATETQLRWLQYQRIGPRDSQELLVARARAKTRILWEAMKGACEE